MLTNEMLFSPLTNCEKNRIRRMIREIDTSESVLPNPNAFKERKLISDLICCLEFRCNNLDDFIRNIDFLICICSDEIHRNNVERYGLAICKELQKWREHNEKRVKLST